MVKTVKPTKPPDKGSKEVHYNKTVENENGFEFRKEPVQSNKADHYVGFSEMFILWFPVSCGAI
jgi:hypothetical protein